ncbi:hypothetical protein [Carnobacterium divergens]|uniref:hypothetical protein n=1 Tax=Carnobacterium divergens TaxID=2748 RepID=UPI00288C7E36|nr:hypothetical protein [Carnobacterium divergens]MDT1961170.1 hypothetical protein [Carnobacterium divergens]
MNKKYMIYIPFLTLLCSGATIKAEENEETPKKPLSSFSIEEKSFISGKVKNTVQIKIPG